jgi:MoaA/NifB/PqqE/SkfB family radical SAM enzyme
MLAMSGDTFCILAFNHIQIDPNGDCRLCCRATDVVRDLSTGIALNVKNISLDHIFHSQYYDMVRQQMNDGKRVDACSRCYADESLTGSSYRTFSNSKWTRDMGSTPELEPVLQYIQINPGNTCNLQCKSCNADYSSSIEANPVHSQWSPGLASTSKSIGNIPSTNTLCITTQELIDMGSYMSSVFGLILKDYTLYFPEPPGKRIELIRVLTDSGESRLIDSSLIKSVTRQRLGQSLAHVLPLDVWSTNIYGAREFEVKYVNRVDTKSKSESRSLGARPLSLLWRFSTDADWHMQDAVIFGDILSNAATIKEVYFTGGEPMMSPLFPKVLRYLLEMGYANTIKIQLNSNISLLTKDIVELLLGFKEVQFSVSLDGTERIYEYIRYPSKYANIEDRLELLRGSQMSITLVPILTCFNAGNLPAIADLADDLNFDLSIYPAQGPTFVDCSCLPPAAIKQALLSVEQWCVANPESRLLPQMQSACIHLREAQARHSREMTLLMLRFCRDVDSRSGRYLAEYIPDLHQSCIKYLGDDMAISL